MQKFNIYVFFTRANYINSYGGFQNTLIYLKVWICPDISLNSLFIRCGYPLVRKLDLFMMFNSKLANRSGQSWHMYYQPFRRNLDLKVAMLPSVILHLLEPLGH